MENVTERVFDTELPLLAPSTAPLALKYTETAPVVPGVMSRVYAVPLPKRLCADPFVIVKSARATPVTLSENVIVTGIG